MNGELDFVLDDGDYELVVKYIESFGVSDDMKIKILEGVLRKKDKVKFEVNIQDDEFLVKCICWNLGWLDIFYYYEVLVIFVILFCFNIKWFCFNLEIFILGILLDEYFV